MRLAYVVNNAAFFVSHRLPIAIEMIRRGHSVALFVGRAGSEQLEMEAMKILQRADISVHRATFKGSGLNPISELFGFMRMLVAIRKFKPDIMHCASPKGVLYGAFAAKVLKVRVVVLAISGMGHLFTPHKKWRLTAASLRLVYKTVLSHFLKSRFVRVIVQNHDDLNLVLQLGGSKGKIILIKGSGVDLDLYKHAHPRLKAKIVLFPARLLAEKGIFEFLAAARSLKQKYPNWRFLVAGAAGYDNPSALTRNQIESICDEGDIEWLGHRDDMPSLFMEADIVCLPSYREGMPKALLEAAAAHCAVITTDVPGCREAIVENITGELVPAKDSIKLELCIETLIQNEAKCENYGRNGRNLALKEFSIDAVIAETIKLYERER